MRDDASMVTTIIVNYFCAELTAGAVSSVLADLPDSRVIVVDNSVDATEAAHLRHALAGRAQLLVNARNTGFGAACNLAFQSSDSDYLMLLNPDARVAPGCLSGLAATLDANPGLGAASPLQRWDPEGDWLLPPAWLPTGIGMWSMERAWRSPRWAAALSRAYRNLALQVWQPQAATVPQRALSGGAMIVRRAAVASSGGLFDPAYFMYYEDSDLCLRLRRAGWRLAMVPRLAALHEWQHSDAKVAFMETSKHIYLQRHFDGRGAWARRLALCVQQPAGTQPLAGTTLTKRPEALAVPRAWQDNWLLEVSPSPMLIPSIGRPGRGPECPLPRALLARLGTGPIYLRLGATRPDALAPLVFVSPGVEAAG